MENYQNYEYKDIKLFKHFELNDNVLAYQTYREKKIRKIKANTQNSLLAWVDSRIIANLKMMIDLREHRKANNLESFNNLNVGDVIYWVEGYDCSLYQFAKVIKKTAKTVTYQKYEYRGMDSTSKLADLALTDKTFTLSYNKAKTNLYNKENEENGLYQNNSD